MHFTLAEILKWLLYYKYLALFPLMVIGGPVVAVASGSLVAAKILNFAIVFLVIVAADLTGDTIYYSIGRWGGLNFIKRWGHYIGIDEAKVSGLKSHFVKHGGKTLLFGKWTQAIGGVILLAAGAAEMPYLTYLWYNLLATLPKTLLLLLIGFYFIRVYLKFHQYSNYSAIIFILLIILVLLIYRVIKVKKLGNQAK